LLTHGLNFQDNLSEDQKQEMAVSLASLAVYDGGVELTAESIGKMVDAAGTMTRFRSYGRLSLTIFFPQESNVSLTGP
jgi:hypothetical protein